MPASKAQQKAVSKYMKENYDEIKVRVEKGRREDIRAHAEAQGESTNGFINRAIMETMERDSSAPGGSGTSKEAGTVSLSPATLKAAQEAAEAEGEGVPVFIARAVETQAQRDALSRKLTGGNKNGG